MNGSFALTRTHDHACSSRSNLSTRQNEGLRSAKPTASLEKRTFTTLATARPMRWSVVSPTLDTANGFRSSSRHQLSEPRRPVD